MSRTLPHNLDAEKSILGAILIANELFGQIAAVLRADMFFRDGHQRIFRALEALVARRSVLDLVTVCEYLQRQESGRTNDLEEAGGPAYIAALVDGVPRSTNVEYYAQIVLEHWQARQVIFHANTVIDQAYTMSDPIASTIDAGVQKLVDVGAAQVKGDLVGPEQLAREALQYLQDVEDRRNKGVETSGFATGLFPLDRMTDGLQPGQLTILAARPSQGKTALGLQIALNDGPTNFFSLEMQRGGLTVRALASMAKIDGWDLKRGRLMQDQYGRLTHALEEFSQGSLYINDSTGLAPQQIRAMARKFQIAHGLKLVVVDYLTLMNPRTNQRGERNRQEDVAMMTQALKEMAREMRVPVLALAQLNRALEGRASKEPTLADLRESGAIEQIADLIMFIHRPDGNTVAEAGPVQIIIAKQREGPTGKVELYWHPSQTRFSQAA